MARRDPDADDRAAQARAAILDLWEHRSAWPHGWPPAGAATLVRILDDLPQADDPGWRTRTVLGQLQLLHHRLLAALCDLAVPDGDTVAEGWLNTFGDRLAADEVALLTRAASAPRRLAVLFSMPRTAIRRRPRSTDDTSGTTAGTAETDDVAAQDHGRTDDTDDMEDATPIPVLEIAEEYRDVVAELLRGSDPDQAISDDARRRH